ncbi:MAG TPA: multidrug effflux MFS transporter [Microvirga sp.]|nr:multidrug effflux MFS transporter [Microvirga sp.]
MTAAPAAATLLRPPLWVLIAISMLQPFALNVLAPATPGLARSLQTDYATVQLTLTLYLMTVAVVQLLVGPISDRIGRRPCILAGIALFAVGSVLGALAEQIETLLLARVVQAAGGGTCFALSRAVVRDTASRDESASLIGYITMGMVVAPMIAPMIGGVIDSHFGWRAIFLAMLAMTALVAAGAVVQLRETAPREGGTGLGDLFRGYPELLRSPAFVGYALALSSTSAAFFSFIAGAPYVVVDVMGHKPDVYGYFFALNAGAYMIGNFLSGRFGQQVGSERLARAGVYCSVVSVGLAVLCFAALPWTPATLFVPLMLNGLGNGLTIPGGTALALSVRPDLAGTAAGLTGALQLGLGALASIVTGFLVTVWAPSLVMLILVFVLLGWLALAVLVPQQGRAGQG